MFLGCGTSSSVTQAAAPEGSRSSADPKTLVVLTYTKRPTPAAAAASSNWSVPVTFVSMKSCQLWVAT